MTDARYAETTAELGKAGAWLERTFVDLAPGTNLAVFCGIEGTPTAVQYGTGARVSNDIAGPLVFSVYTELCAKGPRYAFKKMAELERAYGFELVPGRSMTEEEALYGV
jgi:hypothetical protein